LQKAAGFPKIGEKVVQHQERKYGVTKFGLNRFIKWIFLDLYTNIRSVNKIWQKTNALVWIARYTFFLSLDFCFALWM